MSNSYKRGEIPRSEIKVEPNNLLASGCRHDLIGLGAVHICAPHLHLGLLYTPCPRHGWKAVDDGRVSTRGMCPARRVYARSVDEWLIGAKQICGLCRDERREAESELKELEKACAEESELQVARAAVKAATYSYRWSSSTARSPSWSMPILSVLARRRRSYHPRSLELYAQRYYWYVAAMPYLVLNKRTAVTREVARQVMLPGSNPTALAKQLLEFKTEWFDLLRAQVIGMHLWARERPSGHQLTLEQLFMAPYVELTHESVGLCAPGHALIRHLFLAVSAAEAAYKLSWRQQNVGVTVGAVDASMKRGNALDQCKVRQTFWSNDVQGAHP